jgi:hypothetical protein
VCHASAQNILTDMDHETHRVYDRLYVLSDGADPLLHPAIKPFWRQDLVTLADSFSKHSVSAIAWHQLQSIYDQNNEFTRPDQLDSLPQSTLRNELFVQRYRLSTHPFWNTFYKTPAHFYEVDVKDFYLRINPILHISVGRENEEGVTTFVNQRGLSIRGGIGRNVFFYTSLYDSQVRYPNFINTFTDDSGVVPGVGLYKSFTSKFFDFTQGRDFLLANAYVGVNFGKYIGLQLGHNQCFIGDGIRSLLLSDFSTPFFSLKINTRIWKFHYQNIFAELAADSFMSVDGISEPVPKKYMAAHYLDFKPTPNISLGLFEAVIFNRAGHQFELQYLNPIILYRTIEGSLGSPDNVLLGLNARVDLWRRASAYGQFMLDDISISNILDGHMDWWGNKFGHQLGFKYYNLFSVDQLDVQVEWNQVRPYTFSHYDSDANYSNYKQALAHPLGANFNEWIVSGSYFVTPKLLLKSSLYLIQKGEDIDSVSYGGNILAPNTTRPGDFGHAVAQGATADIFIWSSRVQYEVVEGGFINLSVLLRKKNSTLDLRDQDTQLFTFGIRYNLPFREEIF